MSQARTKGASRYAGTARSLDVLAAADPEVPAREEGAEPMLGSDNPIDAVGEAPGEYDARREVERLLQATGELAEVFGAEPAVVVRALAAIIRKRAAFERLKAATEIGHG